MADLLKSTSVETPSAPVEVPGFETKNGTEERTPERAQEKKERVGEGVTSIPLPTAAIRKAPASDGVPVANTPVQKDAVTMEVEHILEEGLGEMYKTLPPDAKVAFRERGEHISNEIATMVRTFRVKVSNVLRLIRSWLHTIPGVNKFFLEQEAKLKTDAILELAKTTKEGPPPNP